MRDIDQALARHYDAASPAPRGASRRPSRPATSRPGPHFAVPPRPPGPAGPVDRVDLEWPATVLALEQAHGPRFHALAETVRQVSAERRYRVLLFTSAHRAEGRTTLVLTLARALARRPGRTLLVDGDLSGPMLARLLGLRPRIGLEDLLAGEHAIADALVDPGEGNLAILPLRAAVPRPREVIGSPAWTGLMGRLGSSFDLVLVDGSPLFTGLGSTRLPAGVDAAVLVHHRAVSGERALRRARSALAGAGIPLLGLAETFVG